MVSFCQKLKMPKTCQKPFYKKIINCSVQKTARENTKYSRNETISKLFHLEKLIAFQKLFYKNIRVVLCKKTVEKKKQRNKYWINETISKMGNLAKAIALAKWSVWVKN